LSAQTPPPETPPRLAGYEVVVGVTGGIAAFKTAAVVSKLVQAGAGVTVVMTASARRFVGPLTFHALTGRPVHTSLWHAPAGGTMDHLAIGERADLVVVAPATANIIGKLAGGIADDLLSTLLLGVACPLLLAPAMNPRMWHHPAVQRNVALLREWGGSSAGREYSIAFIGPDAGRMACGDTGPGRMVEPEALLDAITAQLVTRPPRA
jgi:phosphopantothenoylcysteine decarboxylase/phosphopantothenate--cysteine ligase